MPRQARLDGAGALHHIMVRAINKEAIFRDTQDKARFLERLATGILEVRCSVYAWVIMFQIPGDIILILALFSQSV